jgi:hypothetical protein
MQGMYTIRKIYLDRQQNLMHIIWHMYLILGNVWEWISLFLKKEASRIFLQF